MKQLEAEEREAQRLHEEAQHLHEERMKQLEQKLRDLEAREQLQDQEGIEQSHMEDVMEEIPEQGIWYPLDDDAAEEDSLKMNEDTPDKDSCEFGVMASEKKVPLIEDKTWGLEEVLKLEQKSGAEEKDLLNVEQVLMELGAREQPQNHGGIGQSHMKKAEPETATVETTGPGKILFEAGDLAWRETTHRLKIDEGSNSRHRGVVHSARGSHNNDVSRTGESREKEGMVSLWDKAVPRRVMWTELEDVLADKLQKATSAIQVLVLQLDEEIQAGNDKVPRMEIDTEVQKAIALKDLAKAMRGKFQVISSDKPGRCKLVKHRKHLTSDVPVQSWPYTIPYAMRPELVRRLKLARLAARPSKCATGAKTVQLLGHHVGDGMLGLGRDNLEKVG